MSSAAVRARFFSATDRSTAILALGLMSVIALMVLPAPPLLLDIGLTFSFALAILIFAVTIFIERPLDFSAFPTLLLASLMLRLALNVSSTRLIIGEGHTGTHAAGEVIEGFATFVMGGNVFLGIVVFAVITIVNFMVVTKGAGRMAEVGARFALDGMPGKQLAIDSDVAAGAISHDEAKERRRIELEEATFFGSLDGASKFVKGDAVAGLLIIIVNLVVGVGMGVGAYGLSMGDAIETYAVLTVGDGLVSQIPAVVTSVAAALLLSKGGAAGSADKALLRQVGSQPVAVMTVAVCLGAFALAPGLPFAPFMASAAALMTLGVWMKRRAAAASLAAAAPLSTPQGPTERPLGDLISVDEIQVEFAVDLVPLALDNAVGLEGRVARIRHYVASEFGFIVPPIRLTDNADFAPGEYLIRVQGVEAARFRLDPTKALIIIDENEVAPFPGDTVEEPVYGAPARWIDKKDREQAATLGYSVIEPEEVLATHLLETVKANFSRLMTRRAIRRIFDEYVKTSDPSRSAVNRQLIDEFVPDKAPIETVQAVFRLLLDEGVSIRNIPQILEAIAEARPFCNTAEEIGEHVRRRLSRQITARLRNDKGQIPIVQIGPDWEPVFQRHETQRGSEKEVALPPEEFNRLARSVSDQLKKAAQMRLSPAVVTFAERRRFIRTVLSAKGVRAPVIAYDEIDPQSKPLLIGAA